MDDIYIKSIQAVQKIMINDKHCFELYPLSITDYSIYNVHPGLMEASRLPNDWQEIIGLLLPKVFHNSSSYNRFFCGVSSLTWTRYGYDILVDSKLKP